MLSARPVVIQPERDKIDAEIAAADTLYRQGKLTDARAMLEQALQRARQSSFVLQEARAIAVLADIAYENSQTTQARTLADQAFALFDQLGSPQGRGRTLHLQ